MTKTSYFITGTDTNSGKTIGTAALAAGWQDAGEQVGVMKPIQTGAIQHDDKSWSAPDLDYTLTVLSTELNAAQYALHAPVCYACPCSPHLAATRAKRPVDIERICETFKTLEAQYERLLLEGAGGLMVPLNEDLDMIDLIKALNLPCLLAVRPTLGTLNHSQLSADALARAGLTFAGWFCVSTRPDPWDFIEEDNISTLRQRLDAPYLGSIPYIEHASNPSVAREKLRVAGAELISNL